MEQSGVQEQGSIIIETRNLNIYYGDFLAVKNANLKITKNIITAIIGPSGCGKSTMLRAFNRMNDLVPTSHATGEVLYGSVNIYDPQIDPVEIRRRIGMKSPLCHRQRPR